MRNETEAPPLAARARRHDAASCSPSGGRIPSGSIPRTTGEIGRPANPINACRMARAERLDEVARLLALAILRRRERAGEQPEFLENSLDLSGDIRPDVPDARH